MVTWFLRSYGNGCSSNDIVVYGQGNEHTSTMLKMTMTETIAFKANYFAQIPEARPFIQTVHQVVKMRGYVKNFYGRRRRLSTKDCYKAPNALIQGCAADYIKSKVVDIYKYLMFEQLETHMTNIVHDELVIDQNKDESEHVPVLRWLLSDFKTFRCPITAGAELGNPSWGEKVSPENVGFKEPDSFEYLNYNVYDGSVFNIYKENRV